MHKIFFLLSSGELDAVLFTSVRSNPTTSAAVHNQRSKLMMDNMNAQFAAIAALAEHMDNDFSNTELVSCSVSEYNECCCLP